MKLNQKKCGNLNNGLNKGVQRTKKLLTYRDHDPVPL